MTYPEATSLQIDEWLQQAWNAFISYKQYSLQQRATFMKAIAAEMEARKEGLVKMAVEETNLPEARLAGEHARTVFQLRSYAEACESGNWLDARIDTGDNKRTPPKPDIRKMLVPLGPVVVFGASNFPFAYSTAGGDTACAFAAGCPVIVKAHPAHAQTSEMVAEIILKAAGDTDMPEGIFTHVHGTSFEVGKSLVTHTATKAVGFTGSFSGGKALFDLANQRKEPIPVFAEMGSVNPVFLFPDKLSLDAGAIAAMYAVSITQSVGQFCTNPGLIIGVDGPDLEDFLDALAVEIKKVDPGTMLHPGIAKAFSEKRAAALSQQGVNTIAVSDTPPGPNQGQPTIATATGITFLGNNILHQEVFGPYSIVIRCSDMNEMMEVASRLEGQLTASLMATEKDITSYPRLVDAIQRICGRCIMNGVPTGVEVCLSMQHGGPYPATTDSRFTSVGADGIRRFARPVAFQNWPDGLLPVELQDDNPLNIWRTVNNDLTKDPVV